VRSGGLRGYARTRNALLRRITAVLDADPRVVSAWLSGSFGRGQDDAWSDIDLHLAVQDEAFPGFLQERDDVYRRIGSPLLVQPDMPSPTQPGSRYQLVVYPGPIEVDWIVGPASQAVRPRETRLLVARGEAPIVIPPSLTDEARRTKADEALVFFWAMAPIAVKYAGRGESRRASHQIDLLTGAFILLWRLVELPCGPDPSAPAQNRGTEAALDARLPRLEWDIDPGLAIEVIRQLCAEVERLHPFLAALGVPIPAAMPAETAALADLADAVIRRGKPADRRLYR
jgi:predicted nucleotidyltransferase